MSLRTRAFLMELASRAEELGWDGLFLWDHIRYRAPTRDLLDCWVALSAIATATERIRIGPMVTPIARRRPHKLARETVTLDHLSQGRLTLGVGLGSDNNGELGPFGEENRPEGPRQPARRRPRQARGLLDRRVRARARPTAADPGVGGWPVAESPPTPPRG